MLVYYYIAREIINYKNKFYYSLLYLYYLQITESLYTPEPKFNSIIIKHYDP